MPEWPFDSRDAFDNSLLRDLREEQSGRSPHESREVMGAHYTRVRPTVPAPKPAMVVYSADVASQIGLSPSQCESDPFLAFFSGSVPDGVETWATVYGASFGGRYGGQRGDGRAISVGQVAGRELQLKGAGVTPYSRRFDGRAVLRSCVREFLASEAMAALGVPTTRALCVVSTGDSVLRSWYDDGREKVLSEAGAVGTRVASSFLRFGQMEIFHQRGEAGLLRELASHALDREFSHLRVQYPGQAEGRLFVRMFEEIAERQAHLVAEWIRVGYCQGNLNSDNSALAGFTLDYGPFGFMEKFAPLHNPWVGGGVGYSFARQPQAAAINLVGLSEAFVSLVSGDKALSKSEREVAVAEVRAAVSHGYVDAFNARQDDNCRAKLGLSVWDEEADGLWSDLFGLMSGRSGSGIDFTLFFRALGDETAPPTAEPQSAYTPSADTPSAEPSADLLRPVRRAALDGLEQWPAEHIDAWRGWATRYWTRVAAEGRPPEERRAEMSATNPKYILRNTMAAEAYEAAARGDYSIVREVHELLLKPYEDQGEAADERWAQPTPRWAREQAGLAFMS